MLMKGEIESVVLIETLFFKSEFYELKFSCQFWVLERFFIYIFDFSLDNFLNW